MPIKDVDNKEKYLYVEFIDGGYTIYDRVGQFIYERSEIGTGPYHDFLYSDEELYYGGPMNYFEKENNQYCNTVTDEKTDKKSMSLLSEQNEKTRTKYVKGETTTMSLSASRAAKASKLFILGQNIKDENMASNAGWYFTSLGASQSMNYDSQSDLQICGNDDFVDSVCGKNKYGSCVFVALSSVMLYYDRIGKANMVPDDINNFNLMYDLKVKINDSRYAPYVDSNKEVYLSNLNKNLLKSEFLHQELLYLRFPEFRNYGVSGLNKYKKDNNGKDPFLQTISLTDTVLNQYWNKYGLTHYNYQTQNGTYLLPERIVEGNPCIMLIQTPPDAKKDTGAIINGIDRGVDFSHAVVVYAFTGSKGLWYGVDELVCNFGWADGAAYGCVYINNEAVSSTKYYGENTVNFTTYTNIDVF